MSVAISWKCTNQYYSIYAVLILRRFLVWIHISVLKIFEGLSEHTCGHLPCWRWPTIRNNYNRSENGKDVEATGGQFPIELETTTGKREYMKNADPWSRENILWIEDVTFVFMLIQSSFHYFGVQSFFSKYSGVWRKIKKR